MAKKSKSDVADDAALEDTNAQEPEDSVTVNPDDAAEQEEALDEDQQVADEAEEEEEESSEDEIEPELMLMATAGGMTEVEAIRMGRTALMSYLAARSQLRPDEKKEPEEDPFALKLDPEVAAELSPVLLQEIKRIAIASRDGIKAARDEVAPLKAEVENLRRKAQENEEQRNFNALQDWCDQQKDSDLGDSRDEGLGEKQKKVRFKMWKEILRVRGNLRADARIPVSDVCEIAYSKVFKGKRKQQARRKVAKEATRQSESAVGRASTVKRPPGTDGTKKTSEESVRALFRSTGMP